MYAFISLLDYPYLFFFKLWTLYTGLSPYGYVSFNVYTTLLTYLTLYKVLFPYAYISVNLNIYFDIFDIMYRYVSI